MMVHYHIFGNYQRVTWWKTAPNYSTIDWFPYCASYLALCKHKSANTSFLLRLKTKSEMLLSLPLWFYCSLPILTSLQSEKRYQYPGVWKAHVPLPLDTLQSNLLDLGHTFKKDYENTQKFRATDGITASIATLLVQYSFFAIKICTRGQIKLSVISHF